MNKYVRLLKMSLYIYYLCLQADYAIMYLYICLFGNFVPKIHNLFFY